MLKKRIPIGIEFYKEMIDENYYYVDKTLLIKELLDNSNKVFCLPDQDVLERHWHKVCYGHFLRMPETIKEIK